MFLSVLVTIMCLNLYQTHLSKISSATAIVSTLLFCFAAQWERLFPSDQYVLGKPMYFEAEAPSISQDKRLYLHSCYATPEKSHTSTPQFLIVKNFG